MLSLSAFLGSIEFLGSMEILQRPAGAVLCNPTDTGSTRSCWLLHSLYACIVWTVVVVQPRALLIIAAALTVLSCVITTCCCEFVVRERHLTLPLLLLLLLLPLAHACVST
jgi:hypothetical protein